MSQTRGRKSRALKSVAGAMALLLGALPSLAAEGWQGLSDDTMAPALVARTMGFADGSTWGFFADGRVLSEQAWGRWQIGDESLCLNWPGADTRCYSIEQNGIDLRFTPIGGGAALLARYVDL